MSIATSKVSPTRCLAQTWILASPLLLASCGTQVIEQADRIDAFEHMMSDVGHMVQKYQPISFTEMTSLPTTGAAAYAGYVNGIMSNRTDSVPDAFVGRISVQVAFDEANMVSGTAGDFLDDQGFSLAGNLNLSGGRLDRMGDPASDPTFTFNGNGHLTDRDGQVLTVTSSFQGDFLGGTGEGIGGDILGKVTVNDVEQRLGGLFILERRDW